MGALARRSLLVLALLFGLLFAVAMAALEALRGAGLARLQNPRVTGQGRKGLEGEGHPAHPRGEGHKLSHLVDRRTGEVLRCHYRLFLYFAAGLSIVVGLFMLVLAFTL